MIKIDINKPEYEGLSLEERIQLAAAKDTSLSQGNNARLVSQQEWLDLLNECRSYGSVQLEHCNSYHCGVIKLITVRGEVRVYPDLSVTEASNGK